MKHKKVMKHNMRSLLTAGILANALISSAAALIALAIPTRLAAQEDQAQCKRNKHNQYRQINLVANTKGAAIHTDPLIVNAWGLGFLKDGPFWVTDEATGVVTIYNQFGKKAPLVVHVPAAPSLPAGTLGTPTGLVVNTTSEFVISKNGKSGPALFIVDSLDGTISGWNPHVDLNNFVIMVDYSTKDPFPASYTSVAIGRNKQGKTILYAADSGATCTTSNNEVDMFDGSFRLIGHFGDSTAPSNMTVYAVQYVDGKLFVPFAACTPLAGGAVDVFDTEGNFETRFAENSPAGPLQAPFAVIRAPADFGRFSNKLLIGGVEDGHINAYDPVTHKFLGILRQPDGKPIYVDGLWAIEFGGGGKNNGKPNQLFFVGGCGFNPNIPPEGSFGFIAAVDSKDGDSREE